MTIKEAAEQIKRNWRDVLPKIGVNEAKIRVNHETSFECPFCGHGAHGDGLTYNPKSSDGTGLKCFGPCGFSGSDIDLYMKWQKIPDTQEGYIEAVKELADIEGLTIDEYDRTERPQTASKGTGAETIHKEAKRAYRPLKTPPAGKYKSYIENLQPAAEVTAAREYLEGRGINAGTAAGRNLRYEKAHTFHDRKTGQKHTCPAIIFPYSINCEYYYARAIQADVKAFDKPYTEEGEQEPIYNSAALYNGRPCFITEAPLDALSIIQAGGNAASLVGTGYDRLLQQIAEKAPAGTLILCLDSDSKGERAQAGLSEELTAQGIPFINAQFNYTAYKETDTDPNDFYRSSLEAFTQDIAYNIEAARPKSEIELFLEETLTEKYKGVPTGVKSLDEALNGGLIPQTLVLLSAEAGSGKTALATQIWENMAREGHPCIYLNLEMSKQQMLARSISRRVYVETNHSLQLSALNILRGYEQTEATRDRVRGIALEFERTTLKNLRYNPLEGEGGNNLDTILQYIENEAQKATAAGLPAPYICVDYLHILSGRDGEKTEDLLKRAVFEFKRYAERYNSIVLAIMAEARYVSNSNTPTIQAGRDSSGLEYTADLQMQLKTTEKGLKNDEIALHITKSRFTQTKMREGLKFGMFGAYSYLEERGTFTPGNLDFDDTIEDDSEPQTKGHKGRRRKSADKVQEAYIDNSQIIDYVYPDDPD